MTHHNTLIVLFSGAIAFLASSCASPPQPASQTPPAAAQVAPVETPPPPPPPPPLSSAPKSDSPQTGSSNQGTSQGSSTKYGIEDLQALEKQSSWLELVEHLEDIAPSQRDETWQKLAERASTELLSTMSRGGDPMTAPSYAEGLTSRYPILTQSRSFMDKRAEVGLKGFEACYDRGYQECNRRFLGFVQGDPDNVDLAMKAGRLVVTKQFAYVAVQFFKLAVVGKKNPAKECNDSELQRSVKASLESLPPDHPLHREGQQVRDVCKGKKR